MTEGLNSRDFSGTNITTPADKMRAMAIIGAKDDYTGLNMINFNITTFMKNGKDTELMQVLGMWAVEPVKRSPGKFIRFPAAGKEALHNRVEALMKQLSNRPDLNDNFIFSAKEHMKSKINKEIMYLGYNENQARRA